MSFYDSLDTNGKIKYHKMWEVMKRRYSRIQREYGNLDDSIRSSMLYETAPATLGYIVYLILFGFGLSLAIYVVASILEGGFLQNIVGYAIDAGLITFFWRLANAHLWEFKYCDDADMYFSSLKPFYKKIMKNGGFEIDKLEKGEKDKAA